MATRAEFEARPEWRATIRRRKSIVFILAGQGALIGRFYEYPEDWILRARSTQPLETEVKPKTLHAELAAGQIVLLKGALPQSTDIG
jgi:hypothetical protein